MEEFISIIFLVIFGTIFLLVTFLELCWPILIPVLIISQIRKNKSNKAMKNNVINASNNKEDFKKKYKDIDQEKLRELDIDDLNKLKAYLYEIFYKFEKAYNDLDYNTMINTSTAKLYNNYHTNIVLNLRCAQKKIIENIELKKVTVYDIFCTTRKQVISTIIEIENISYMMDHQGKIISGKTSHVQERFEVLFVKNYDNNASIKCPNCGASVSGSECEYCGTKVRNNEFRIDSIKKII